MSDFFKSAMGYFNGPADTNNPSNGEGGSTTSGGPETDFMGQLVEVNAMKLRIKRLIAMGEWSSSPLSHSCELIPFPSGIL